MRSRMVGLAAAALVLAMVGTSQAVLIDRGGGLIYDTVLNITWLQDADLAASETFGISVTNPFGAMNWATTEAWLAAMNAAHYLGYSDWRLPHTLPVNGSSYNYYWWVTDGSTDQAYNISAPGSAYPGSTGSEMAYMFYNNLGNRGYFDVKGFFQPQPWCENTGPFENLINYIWWSGTPFGLYPDYQMWGFSFGNGGQSGVGMGEGYFAWPVFDGDVGGSVPLPGAVWLLGPSLIGLLGLKRKILG